MPASPKDIAEWERRVDQYKEIIAKFEKVKADLLKRRQGAADSVLVLIEERSNLNDRMLQSMRQGMEAAQDELRRLKAKT